MPVMVVQNWIDIIRNPEFFRLIQFNMNDDCMVFTSAMRLGTRRAMTVYDGVYEVKNIPVGFPTKPPNFFTLTEHTLGTQLEGGVLRHWFGNLAFFWGREDPTSPTPIYLHRSDGYPASIELVNFTYYTKGKDLHREGYAAIKAEHVIASWFEEDQRKRANGPCIVDLENHREKWRNGNFIGCTTGHVSYRWNIYGGTSGLMSIENLHNDGALLFDNSPQAPLYKFLKEHEREIEPYHNQFFSDIETEFIYISEFGA